MRALGRETLSMAFLAASLAFAGCNKGAAQESLREAEEALEGARADLLGFAPGELGKLRGALETAHAHLEDGRYTDALRIAQALPARVRAAKARVERRRHEILSVWDAQSSRVPAHVASLERRVAFLGASSAGVSEARLTLDQIQVAWEEARRRHREGDVARAVAIAEDVEATLQGLELGLGTLHPSVGRTPEEGNGP